MYGRLADAGRAVPIPPEGPCRAVSTALLRRPGRITVPLDQLLLGAQAGWTAREFAERTDDLLWPSTRLIDGPHVDLLRRTDPTDEEILASPYGRMARRCIDAGGRYFGASDDTRDHRRGAPFPAPATTTASGGPNRAAGSTPSWSRRSAAATTTRCSTATTASPARSCAGEIDARVVTKWMPVTTPLQDLLLRMSWLDGTKELYQPIHAPELEASWTTVRRCTDRLEKMRTLLAERGVTGSYLDVASCYGWFVGGDGQGWASTPQGLERDPLAVPLGRAAYGLREGQIGTGDAVELLAYSDRVYDVVSCFSLLHHFVLGRGSVGPEALVKLLDRATGKVLFLDTGQENEAWFRTSLAGWNAGTIAELPAAAHDVRRDHRPRPGRRRPSAVRRQLRPAPVRLHPHVSAAGASRCCSRAASSPPRRTASASLRAPAIMLGATGQTRQEIQQRESETGHRLEGVRVFRRWDETPLRRQPAVGARRPATRCSCRSSRGGRTARSSPGATSRWRRRAARCGADMQRQAAKIKQFGALVYVVFNHEPDAQHLDARWAGRPTSSRRGATSSARYRAAGVRNARYVWTMTGWSFTAKAGGGRTRADVYYPGDAYVDDIAGDTYNLYTCHSARPAGGRARPQLLDPQRRFGLRHPAQGPDAARVRHGRRPGEPGPQGPVAARPDPRARDPRLPAVPRGAATGTTSTPARRSIPPATSTTAPRRTRWPPGARWRWPRRSPPGPPAPSATARRLVNGPSLASAAAGRRRPGRR